MAQDEHRDLSREQNGEGDQLQEQRQVTSEMAKAFQELAKGEQTASALERQLDGIESRIEALLAAAEQSCTSSKVQDDLGQDSSTSKKP